MELKDSFVGRLLGQNWFRTHKTEDYVEIPPALLITDERGDVWSLGTEYTQVWQRFFWNVLRNDMDTGENAERMLFQRGKVRIYCWDGWKVWSGRSFI